MKRKGGSIREDTNQVIMRADHAPRITLVIIGVTLSGVIWYFYSRILSINEHIHLKPLGSTIHCGGKDSK